jgi:hypothetical protein
MDSTHEPARGAVALPQIPKKPYRPPQLTVYGQVAALTQSNGCSASNDSATNCTPGAMGGSMASDRRLKQDIVRVGEHPRGFGLYLFSYRTEHRASCGEGRHFGVMADEVEQVLPAAVVLRDDGFKAVDYSLLGIDLSRRH